MIPAQFGASGGQRFRSEMAMFSWNLMQLLVGLSTPAGPVPQQNEFDRDHPFRTDGCSFAKPQYCSSYSAFFTISDVGRNTLRAGGTSRFGRRDFVWHSGGDAVLKYPKRNVLGVSADFAEDTFKSNWSVESTWVGATPYQDNDQYDGLSSSDTYNLTVSVDRPTFINFLNANRTFFFNSQWFFQWTRNFSHSYTSNGPFNVLFTFTVETGYFQDRLTPSMTSVYDFESDSGAFLPSVRYQFSDRFSTEFGFAFFWGRFQSKTMAVNPLVNPGEQVGKYGYHSYVENGLAAVRDRDEIYLRVRYTF